MTSEFFFEEWETNHPRWDDLLKCIEIVTPEQIQFVTGKYYQHYTSYLFIALREKEIVGFLRFAVQPIGPEAKCPTIMKDGQILQEAKIHAFGVHPQYRNKGIGTQLQKLAIVRARELGCYQISSYSCFDKVENYHIKLKLGYSVQPEVHGDNEQGCYFLMPLRGIEDQDRIQNQ